MLSKWASPYGRHTGRSHTPRAVKTDVSFCDISLTTSEDQLTTSEDQASGSGWESQTPCRRMSVNEELLQPSSDSFWEVDSWKRTVKRQDDGFELCNKMCQLVQERADLEKAYAKSLRSWSQKWNGLIEKSSEYGTLESGWKSVLHEADSIAEMHIEVKNKLINEVQANVKQWRADTFHKKHMVGPCKETKELEDNFKKAQKPWAKRYAKVQKAKKDYHLACKQEKTAINQESNARADTSNSADQVKKLQDKVEKCRRDVQATKEKYEAALADINSYNAKYMEDMTEVFQTSQEAEEKRHLFFKATLYDIHRCLDLSADPQFKAIFQQLHSTIGTVDHQQDLRWWSQNHGVDMPMNWPQFEEYSPDMHAISRKSQKGQVSGSDGITLTAISRNDPVPSQRPVSTIQQQQPPPQQPQHHQVQESYSNNSYTNSVMTTSQTNAEERPKREHLRDSAYDPSLNPFGEEDEAEPSPREPTNQNNHNNGSAHQNPFGEDDWDHYDSPASTEESKGVPVRALYDYIGQEEDELGFKAGEVFLKLIDEDEQGWCTGQKDGKIGLYPKNYVEVIDN